MKVVVAIYSDFSSWCIPEAQVQRLREEFPQHTFTRADSDEETLRAIPPADVAFSSRITPAHLAAAFCLRWIHSPAAGVGAMLFPEMVASPVIMTNSRGNSSVTIAEHVIAVTLALLRDLPLAHRRQTEGVWAQNEFDAGASIRTLRGARVLVVGLGSIGSEAARLAIAFGAEVVGLRRHPEFDGPDGIVSVLGPDALHHELPRADIVILAAPQTSATWHLIGDRELSLMKPDSILVNVSRGKLVDEAALMRALDSGRLRGAALDVFENEPLDPSNPLWGRSDVLITPHVSGFHAGYWPEAVRVFAENLRRFEAGQPLENLVDKHAGY